MFKDRGVEDIIQYASPQFAALDFLDLSVRRHVWRRQDRLAKVADLYYGDARLWWVIGYYNQKPTDSHFVVGETIFIPFPFEDIVKALY